MAFWFWLLWQSSIYLQSKPLTTITTAVNRQHWPMEDTAMMAMMTAGNSELVQ